MNVTHKKASAFMNRYRDLASSCTDDYISRFRDFFSNYRRYRDYTLEEDVSTFNNRFLELLKRWGPLKKERDEFLTINAPGFNIFRLFDLIPVEKKHSDFLKVLLNPKGIHRQGYIFLDSFIDLLRSKYPMSEFPDEVKGVRVYRERATEFQRGRLDIAIEFGAGSDFGIIIENKIYSADQPSQIERYYAEAESRFRGGYKIVYLTPNGDDPSEVSINADLRERLKEEGKLLNLSYKVDIASWLESTKGGVKAAKVRAIIEMYKESLKYL